MSASVHGAVAHGNRFAYMDDGFQNWLWIVCEDGDPNHLRYKSSERHGDCTESSRERLQCQPQKAGTRGVNP